jgi:hypothetical protein
VGEAPESRRAVGRLASPYAPEDRWQSAWSRLQSDSTLFMAPRLVQGLLPNVGGMGNRNRDRFQQRNVRQRRLRVLSYVGLGLLALVTVAVVWMALTR